MLSVAPNKVVEEIVRTIDCGVRGRGKWWGIAACAGKLYCAPYNSDSVLVIDPPSNSTTTIDCGLRGGGKWIGIAACGGKLYCAPWNADAILVIDPSRPDLARTVECGVIRRNVRNKWCGIAACAGKLYCAPYNADSILVLDPSNADAVRSIDCGGVRGGEKWAGIAESGGRLYCAPYNADSILVIDPGNADAVRLIDLGIRGIAKWAGIAESGGRLYCAPDGADSILVIDPKADNDFRTIECCGVRGVWKWRAVAAAAASEQAGGKLYCAPWRADSILVIDPKNGDATRTIDCGLRGSAKWSGMAECEGKFYCAPCNADSILLIEPPPVVVEKPPPQEALEVVVVEGKRDEPQASVVALRRAAERVEAARNCDIACDVEKDAERDVVLLLLEPVSTAMARFRREEEEEGGGDDSSRRDPTTLGFLENFQQLRRKARAEGDKLDEAQDLVRRALSSTTSKEEGCGELESLVEQRDAARSAYARALIALQDGYSSSDLARERSALERDADLFEATLSSLEKIRNEFQQGRRSTTTPTTIREGGVTKEAAALREFEVWKQSTDPDAVTDATDNALADSWHKLRDVAETLGANEACEAWKVSYLVAMEAVDRELNFWSSRPHPFSLLPVDPIRKVVVPRLGACRRNLSDLGRADSIVREASRVVEEFGIAEASALLGDKPWREANKRLRAAKKMFRTSRRALEDAQHELEDAKLLGVDDDDDDDDGDDDELVHDDDKREEIVAPPPDLAVFNEEVRAARQELHRAQHAAEDALSKLIDLVRDHYPELGSVAKEAFATVVALSPALRSVVRQGRSQEDYERIPWPDNTEPRASRHVVIACVYDGLPCVLKQFHLRNSSERRALEREVELLVALDHPNIIKLECVFFAENCRPGDAEAVVQTPLYRGGTLRRWLSRPENKVDATETSFSRVGSMRFLNADHRQVATTHVRALRQLLAGLSYVHAKGVVHGDVKLDNALVDVSSTGTSWTVVLSDFEMSHRRRRECTTALDGTSMDMTTTTVGGGTRGYVAPELLVLRDNDGARSTTASDVFAYGICVGVALAVDDATTERVLNEHLSTYEAVSNNDDESLVAAVLRACLSAAADERPTSSALEASPFFAASDKILTGQEVAARRCAACGTARVVGVECRRGGHFTCDECLGPRVLANKNKGRVQCVGCDECYTDTALASHVPKHVFEAYFAAKQRSVEQRITADLRAGFDRRVEVEAKRIAALSGAERHIRETRLHIVERILTLACPRCGAAFAEALDGQTGFDGCFALKCHRCACGFCAYCLADCGTDAHQHVRTCAHGQGLFPTRARETFLRVQRARRDRDLRAYLSKLSSDDVRVVVARLDRELRDLGLDPRAYLLTETPRDSTTNS